MENATTPPSGTVQVFVEKLLAGAIQVKGTDLHLVPGSPPFVRIEGRLTRTSAAPLRPEFLVELIERTSGRSVARCGASFEYSFELPGSARLRGHAFLQGTGWALSLRVVPLAVPTFQELRLPPVMKVLSEVAPGLTLITGPTGSGKSTTAAAMLRHMAGGDPIHVISIEDPIEYRLHDVPACVSQREVGRDTPSFADALRAALREDPDVIFVGEIRDFESLDVAIQAAESGYAVVSTFHTATTLKTIQRMVAMFRPEDQAGARMRLADALRAVVSQRLLPRKGTRGRVLGCEVLINNYAVKECIRDPARLAGLNSVLERSNDQQMHTFDQHLAALVRDGVVALEAAMPFATSPADLKRSLSLAGVG